MTQLTIFYDSLCPLCVKEMQALHRHDVRRQIVFEDLHAADFNTRFTAIDRLKAMQVLHGQLPDGQMLYGLDVSAFAWFLLGRNRWLRMLRWPLIRPMADGAYRLFARHRYRISYWLTGRARCQRCVGIGPASSGQTSSRDRS